MFYLLLYLIVGYSLSLISWVTSNCEQKPYVVVFLINFLAVCWPLVCLELMRKQWNE